MNINGKKELKLNMKILKADLMTAAI